MAHVGMFIFILAPIILMIWLGIVAVYAILNRWNRCTPFDIKGRATLMITRAYICAFLGSFIFVVSWASALEWDVAFHNKEADILFRAVLILSIGAVAQIQTTMIVTAFVAPIFIFLLILRILSLKSIIFSAIILSSVLAFFQESMPLWMDMCAATGDWIRCKGHEKTYNALHLSSIFVGFALGARFHVRVLFPQPNHSLQARRP